MNVLPSRPTVTLLGVLGLVFVPYFAHLPPWLSALLVGLLAWRALIAVGRAGIPPVFTLVVGAAVVAWGIASEYGTLLGRDGGTAFLLLLLALKIHETRTRRDVRVLLLLGYFALGANFFFEQGPLVTLYTLLMTVALTVVAAWWRAPDRPHPRTRGARVVKLVLSAVPLAAALFVVFPRPAQPLWTLPVSSDRAETGLANEISPGSVSSLTKSSAVAFRADFEGAIPPQNELYWRGPVFDDFDGRRWVRSRTYVTGVTGGPLWPPLVEERGNVVRYALSLEPSGTRWVLALDYPLRGPGDVRITNAFQLVVRDIITARRRFELESAPSSLVGRREYPAILHDSTVLPSGGDPRARALGASWATLPPAERVERALAFLRGGNFKYTLEPPALPRENGIDAFLFGTRQGFCEHYASAFAFLMRAAGLPARVVSGYLGGEVNPNGNYLIVRQSFAHAWTEVWLDGEGWRRVDPTGVVSPARLSGDVARSVTDPAALPPLSRGANSLLSRLSLRIDALQTAWNDLVAYDGGAQAALLASIGLAKAGGASLLLLCVAVVVLATLPMLFVVRGRVARPDPLVVAFDLLARRVGVDRSPSESAGAYAARVASVKPDVARDVRALAHEYETLRYGRGANADSVRAFVRKVRRFRARG
ncbi:transglutaminase TgpA family protein [Deinococcus yavapaiensis]|uniref:Transglutaminase-like putative cysteine protease n=1 Tax=Deinococcus yavapaiensis KR-236 TaxID=694435 RepID=A0A318SAT3_9DEIO|nr:DUF3488 and DUF4129 domain-containing transglutaminase family protein [Deinococcus yavapaiensis]PYE56489.1 transglutaminase-like putative cysteine protease [Deinococcus yavapaiensis KR-236]